MLPGSGLAESRVDAIDRYLLFGNILDQHISEVEEQLFTLAEREITIRTELHLRFLEKKINIFQDCGLSLLAQAIQRFVESPDPAAKHLLSLSYLTLLHHQAAQLQGVL